MFAAYADPASPWLETTTVATPEVLLDLDLDALGAGRSPGLTPADGPLFCVCAHGRHDACCAERGRPTAAALTRTHPEETWEVSHIGGDRFAPNMLVLPQGLYYGGRHRGCRPRPGVAPTCSATSTSTTSGAGPRSRSRCRSPRSRRAVRPARRVSTRCGWSPRVASTPTRTVVLDVAGTSYDVVVRRDRTQERHQLTCQAAHTQPIPTFEVVSIDPS